MAGRAAIAVATRELRYWTSRRVSARVVTSPAKGRETRFRSTVTMGRDDALAQAFRIVLAARSGSFRQEGRRCHRVRRARTISAYRRASAMRCVLVRPLISTSFCAWPIKLFIQQRIPAAVWNAMKRCSWPVGSRRERANCRRCALRATMARSVDGFAIFGGTGRRLGGGAAIAPSASRLSWIADLLFPRFVAQPGWQAGRIASVCSLR